MRLKPSRLLLSAVALVLWHIFLAWLARQALPGNTTRWAVLPYVLIALIYLAGIGWAARNLSSESGDDDPEPNRWQAVVAMLLAQLILQGVDWLTLSGPGDWTLSLLGFPLFGLTPFILLLQGLAPNYAQAIDRAFVLLVPLAISYWAPEREQQEEAGKSA